MKRFYLLFVLLLFMGFKSQAQVHEHALGLRGGSSSFGLGGEISYQHGLGDMNRFEFDLGWRVNNELGTANNHWGIWAIYHWVWSLSRGFNWYIGPGARMGIYNEPGLFNNSFTLGIGGQIGLEFDFNEIGVPLLLSLDARPSFGFLSQLSGGGYSSAFGLRYTF